VTRVITSLPDKFGNSVQFYLQRVAEFLGHLLAYWVEPFPDGDVNASDHIGDARGTSRLNVPSRAPVDSGVELQMD